MLLFPLTLSAVLLLTGLLAQVTRHSPLATRHDAMPPLVGQPPDFSGAVGPCKVRLRAEPVELTAEDSLTLTVRVTGAVNPGAIARPDLRQMPRFNKLFQIENLGDRLLAGDQAREFDYRLRPRDAGVKRIPTLPFVYFKPGVIPDYKGYQTTTAEGIPLVVKPRPAVSPDAVQGGVTLPALESLYRVADVDEVLRREADSDPVAPGVLAVLLAVPPLACAAWYALWHRWYPDAARLAWRRRSRAARVALRALRGHPSGEVVVHYLRQRLDLPAEEPTPAEAARHLQQAGLSEEVAGEVADFLRSWDAVRFAPVAAAVESATPARAAELIAAVEDGLCAARPS